LSSKTRVISFSFSATVSSLFSTMPSNFAIWWDAFVPPYFCVCAGAVPPSFLGGEREALRVGAVARWVPGCAPVRRPAAHRSRAGRPVLAAARVAPAD
jgi:hypothetical protein